ncbi:hypothetical protein CERZMDRAFT_89389 [Cercospora zeae-maydis SCOH1-5]|uniref:Helicase C-terminal domain-containing protein n=1 Tax=Cercospora zeae-maydis SCOH1-5 TaxID=717836 RepID=A0A6A6EVJ8_9PEZI|nr:hypothetical protein CERZMDRAFT_89389 [Cercospora zeae-maydis SCOH1-5]
MPQEETTIVRDAPSRPNIAYSVREIDDHGGWIEGIQGVMEEKKRQYPVQDKVIVYCRSVHDVQSLAEASSYTPFHAKVGSNDAYGQESGRCGRDGKMRSDVVRYRAGRSMRWREGYRRRRWHSSAGIGVDEWCWMGITMGVSGRIAKEKCGLYKGRRCTIMGAS